ncbi:MAG: [Fe-Fe] hydrogenase large subunit C-terminal domain-containing protein [Bacillota bacterium]
MPNFRERPLCRSGLFTLYKIKSFSKKYLNSYLGVVSFYSLFSEEPQGKYNINVCMGTACYIKGSQEILKTIEEELHIKEGETTLDKLFDIKVTRCIGACGLAPVITINDKVYGRLSPADIPGIPEFLPHLSSCKSPHEMCGALTKSWYANKYGLDPKNIVNVAIMPCTAKKYEAARPEMGTEYSQDVDYVLTTRELARMIRQVGMDFTKLSDEEYDEPFDQYSGAGMIFGATGGLFEAALRTAYKIVL